MIKLMIMANLAEAAIGWLHIKSQWKRFMDNESNVRKKD